mmetsp:Transcript_51715/g.110574  ORF Transcript_51715/g.110574 Transcript_51715/m.110574 type:complete len:203 (-) Transcript_51715:1601-2209(-)
MSFGSCMAESQLQNEPSSSVFATAASSLSGSGLTSVMAPSVRTSPGSAMTWSSGKSPLGKQRSNSASTVAAKSSRAHGPGAVAAAGSPPRSKTSIVKPLSDAMEKTCLASSSALAKEPLPAPPWLLGTDTPTTLRPSSIAKAKSGAHCPRAAPNLTDMGRGDEVSSSGAIQRRRRAVGNSRRTKWSSASSWKETRPTPCSLA